MQKQIAAGSMAFVLAALLAAPAFARVGESAAPTDHPGAPLAYGDFDGDACEDLAVGVSDSPSLDGPRQEGAVEVLYGRGGSCRPSAPVAVLRPPAGSSQVQDFGAVLAVGDFDRDGFDDLAATAVLVPHFEVEVFVLRGSASGLGDESPVRLTSLLPRAVHADLLRAQALVVADFDGDGRDDLAIAASVFWHYEIVVLFGRGSRGGELEFALAHARFPAPGATDERLRATAGDFDHDGFDDLAVGRLDAGEVRFHYAGPDTGSALGDWRIRNARLW